MMNYSCLPPRWGQTTGVNFFIKNDVLLFTRETWLELVCPCPNANNGCLRSINHHFISFPPLRRPSFVIVPFWVSCWVRAFNKLLVVMARRGSWVDAHSGLPRSIIFLTFRTPRTLTLLSFLLRTSSLFPFYPTSLQNTLKKWNVLMLNKHKRWFHSSRVKFPLFKMSASWFLVSM